MKLLTGSVAHQLDAKNRIRIPAKYRSAFPENEKLYYVLYNEERIAIMPESVLADKMKYFEDINPGDGDAMDAMSMLFYSMEVVLEDKQGRAQLPKKFREYASIDKDVLTVGMGNYIEVWAPQIFEARAGRKTVREVNAALYKKRTGNE